MLIEGEAHISRSKLTGDIDILEVKVDEKSSLPPLQRGSRTGVAFPEGKDSRSINAKNVILAMGSEPASLPGLEVNHRNIIDSTDALKLEIPDELTIVGAGANGLEFAAIYRGLGCKKVAVMEKEEQICPGVLDRDMAEILQSKMESRGIAFELGKGLDVADIPDGENPPYPWDGGKILIAVGRSLNTQELAEKDVALTEKGSVEVNNWYQVKFSNGEYAENLFAVGDITGRQLLAHKGSKEGKVAAEAIARHKTREVRQEENSSLESRGSQNFESSPIDYSQIPSVIFSIPEVASVGLTEEAARESGRIAEVKYLRTSDQKNMVKVILDAGQDSEHRVLGVTIIGSSAPYAIAEMTLAVRMGATLEQLMKEGLTLASAREISSLEEWEEEPVLSTPLTEIHREAGAKMDNFHGWWAPTRYTDAYEEVSALRNNAAIWDIGYMAVLEVSGKEARSFLQFLTTNDVAKLKVGQVQYSFFLDEQARPLDDILVYRLWGHRYLIVVNAANRSKIKRWLREEGARERGNEGARNQYPPSSIEILDLYDCPEEDRRVSLFSLQGPEAENILRELTDFDLDILEYFHAKKIKVAGKRMLVQRGGYSGEEGFEIFAPAKYAAELWQEIMEAGKQFGLKPAGLVARDIARQEACLPLYGNEWPEVDPYDEGAHGGAPLHITPYEAGFGWAVKVDKGDFVGREAYIKHLNDIRQGKMESYAQVAIELEGRWTAYQNCRVFARETLNVECETSNVKRQASNVNRQTLREAGLATSGRFSEYLGKSVWLAYVKKNVAQPGRMVEIEIGRERVVGKIVPKPIVNNIIYPRRGDTKENAKYYITLTPKQIDEMLHDTIGVKSIDALCDVFEEAYSVLRELDPSMELSEFFRPKLGLPLGLSRRKNYQYHARLAGMNYSPKEYSSFLGAGSYDYRIPDVVDWAASLRGIYTPYTPYQAEVAQGLLRIFYIYQSQICQLTGMEVANASLYDGATALAEAAFMSARITSTSDKARNVFLVANPLHPFYYQVLETYAKDVGCEVVQVPFDEEKGTVDLKALRETLNVERETFDVACIIVQQPNFFGQIESELQEVAEIAHDARALFISCTTDPHSLEILEAPAHYVADIAVGEAQAFGNPVNCGGPNLGFLATSKQYLREVPGRIVGRTETDGEETFCLIRQTREQHISRFKAKSNICSNTALCATRAALYMLAQGRTGLHEVNSTTLTLKEFFLNQLLAIPGFELAFDGNSFNEVTVRVPIAPDVISEELLKRRCLVLDAGCWILDAGCWMLFSFTNQTTEADVERLVDALLDIAEECGTSSVKRQTSNVELEAFEDVRQRVLRSRKEFAGEIKCSPKGIQRTMPLNLPQYSESEIIMFARDMADLNIDIDAPLYPLGSCTMKYNPKLNEKIAALEGLSRVHPLAPDCAKQGTLKLAYDFSQYLCQITGMDAVTLQPEAGAHGEFTGLKVIRAAHIARCSMLNEGSRKTGEPESRKASIQCPDLIITSDSSHGTNPASVAMAGMEVLEIPSKDGMIDVKAFRKAVEDNKDRFAGCMLTIPNTLGIFEPETPRICQITHEHGGYVYMDGANFNALIGQIKVRDLGVDVMHFNLHKTFGTPHGGGGPGAGPIAVTAELAPYLPVPGLQYDEEHNYYWLDWGSRLRSASVPHSIGKVGSFFGPYSVVIKANAYRMALGEEGTRKVSETAILNANYMLKRIMSEAVDENGGPLFKVIYRSGQHGFDTLGLDASLRSLHGRRMRRPYGATQPRCMHEFVISSERFEEHGLSAIDFAKGVIDFGVYAPTVGFPLFFDHGRHAIMVEPTETATREGMDYFCDRFIELARKAWEDPEVLKRAPSKLRFRRISVADADRQLDVRSDIRDLLPGYTPISGGEVVEGEIISFVKRKVATQIEGLDIPDIPEEIDLNRAKFMEEGEWAFDLGGGFALCGLSKETAEMIKTLKFSTIHLPKLGTEVEQGEDTGASVDFDKVASPIYAPVSGRVVKINPLLVDEENLDILVDEPDKRGWLFVAQMDNPEEFHRPPLKEDGEPVLKNYEEYLKGLEKEVD
jgi:glycine cleavage system T protein